jgi:allantoinase
LPRAIRSHHLLTPLGERSGCVVFENGRIIAIEAFDAIAPDASLIDAADRYVLPGLIDPHVHCNDPGRADWEGFPTATRAAAAGGYSCIVDMPLNCIPATTTLAALEEKRRAAQGHCWIDYAFWGGAVRGNAADLIPLAEAGVRGFKCFLVHPGIDEFTMVSEADLREALPFIAQTGLPLLVHAETPAVVDNAQRAVTASGADTRVYENYLRTRPDESEVEAIALLIELCCTYRTRIHIVHLSSARAISALERARAEGLPITVESAPHYLVFNAESIASGATQYKCAPPIRTAQNQWQLWEALRDGVIDLLATDHSPCPPALKKFDSGDFLAAWGGIASLSVALPAIWTAARDHGFALGDLVRWMAEEPARLAGLTQSKGRIEPGYDADFTIFDSGAHWEVTPQQLHFRHAISPYLGQKLRGRVEATIVRGAFAFRDGKFSENALGREATPRNMPPEH